MIATVLIAVLAGAGPLAWLGERWHRQAPRWIALGALTADLGLVLSVWAGSPARVHLGPGPWLDELRAPWFPGLGISFHVAMDGLSLLLVLLTIFLGLLAVAASWTEITGRVGAFHLNLLWVLAGVLGVFLAMDLFLFYFFWELMLVPMYFLIALWGHEHRTRAAIKFFIFTQASGLLMLVAILGLSVVHARVTGLSTFDAAELIGTSMAPSTALWLFLGFAVAFAVKLPAVPFHTWLPDAHTEAPTAGSVVLAGLLLKTGAYGFIRFAIPLFPDAAGAVAPVAMAVGVAGILYGAALAFAQTDLKRLVAYTSVSHLGFVLLGIFAWNEIALQGAIMQMICHGLSTGALFIVAGALQERLHTRELGEMGGLWAVLPRMGGVTLVFALASLGLPGLGNFVAEFLVLLGSYPRSLSLTAIAATGLIAATIYALSLVQRAFHGERRHVRALRDLSLREMTVLATMLVALVWLGLYPQPVLDTASPALRQLAAAAGAVSMDLPGR